MMAGYPNVKHGWSDADEYMATQIAIQHFVFQHPEKYPNAKKVKFNNDSWAHWDNEPIIELAKTIYNQGAANPYTPGAESTAAKVKAEPANSGRFTDNGDKLELKIAITASGSFQVAKLTLPNEIKNIVKSGQGSITVNGAAASFKPYILGSGDSFEGIEIKPGDTEVIITLDKKAAEAYVSTPGQYKTAEIQIQALGADTIQAYKGINLNSSNQDYIFTTPGPSQPMSAEVSWTKDELAPPDETPGKGGLKILKYNKKTNTLVSGAIFEIRGVSATNWNFLVHIQASSGAALPLPNGGTAVTGVGFIELRDIRPGHYQITEITPPPFYDYSDLGVNSQVVTVIEEESGLYPQVRFENNPFATLRIKKIDAVTGSPVNGAILRIRNPLTGLDVEMVTMNGGVIELQNLPQGNYEISEVFAPNKYIKSSEVKMAALRWGETTDITFENQPKTELLVKKICGETGAALEGAIFRLTKPDTGDVWEDTTFYDGYAVFIDIPSGIYVLEEIKAPKGYVLDPTPRTIVVQNYKTNEIHIQNFKKPTITVWKVDEKTGEPLTGAEFRITERNDQSRIVGTGFTNADGEFYVTDLQPGWYTVYELQPPPGYLLSDKPWQNVELKPGESAMVKFDNPKCPTITVRKIDAVTGEPVPGVRYEVRKADGTLVGIYTTDSGGQFVVGDKVDSHGYLQPGTYQITEVWCPSNYILDNTPQVVTLAGGDDKSVLFKNTMYPTLVVQKIDYTTQKPVPNATFKIEYENPNGGTELIGTYRTDASGRIVLPFIKVGWYIITEIIPAQGYQLPTNPVTRIYLSPGTNSYTSTEPGDVGGNGEYRITSGFDYPVVAGIVNYPLNSIVIKKADANTGEMLSGATFEVVRVTGEQSGQNGTVICTATTDASGVIVITGLEAGGYTVREISAPPNYIISETNMQSVNLKADGTSIVEVLFRNHPYGSILISKIDALMGTPLAGARFKVTDASGTAVGNANGEYVTDSRGEILIPNVKPGAYVVTEIQAPANYAINTMPQTIQVGTDGKTYKVTFDNLPYGAIIIRKLDSVTHEPLAGAEFRVTASDGSVVGTGNGVFRTDATGTVKIPNLHKGSYIIEEIKSPDGYILENQSQTVAVDYGKTYTIDVYNKKMSGLQIVKIDADSKQPLKGAKFTVYEMNGEIVGTYETNSEGIIILDRLEPGWYKVVETKAPDGWLLDDTPKDVQITDNQFVKLVFENRALASLQIKKLDEYSSAPLAGAVFEVRRQDGRFVGEFTTDQIGTISIPGVEPGWYVIKEIKAPSGYILTDAAKTVEVKATVPTVVTVTNKPLSGLKIIKLDSVSRQPIEDVEFVIAKMNGEKVTNEFNGYSFKTNRTGQIFIPNLADGYYIVTETKCADGYFLDSEPKTVLVESGKTTLLEVFNEPMSGLLIIKTDEKNGKPLQGVVFDVRRADGQLVYGTILDMNQPNTEANSPNRTTSPNGDITGSYTTDAQGRILINSLPAGEYHVTERKALDGYELDTEVHAITVTPGKLATLQLTNRQKAGLRLLKIDAFTKTPIHGAEFMVFDAGRNVVGTYYTDDRGLIDFSGILTEGRYTIRETKPAPGYYADDMPRTVEFVSGEMTEIRWENTPQLGQVQIFKKSGDDNEITGLPAGTLLEGAIFEIYQHKSGNLVDRFVSGPDGRAVSRPLPLGRYVIKEVQAPQYYKLSDKTLDVDVEFATQIVKMEFLNYSANTGVYIKKTGPVEAMPGDTIRYDIKQTRNESTVPLSDFFWRDVLPVDAVRLDKIVTGTFNQSLRYKIIVTTNKGDTRIIADNLSTTKNNVIDCSNASLGLRNDEFVTSFTMIFGTVKAGFSMVETPQIYVKVQNGLPNKYQFANKCDAGGKYGNEWVVGNSTTLCVVYRPSPLQKNPLPRTGY